MRGLIQGVWKEVRDTLRYIRAVPPYSSAPLDYDRYWGVHDVAAWRDRFDRIAAHVTQGARVLEVGCGDGTLLEHLRRERAAEVVGVDVSPRAVELARARGIDARVCDLKTGTLPQGPFDHAIATEVLEHLEQPEQVLLQLREQVRGTVLVTLPNTAFYRDRLRLLFGRTPVQWLMHPAEHLRFFSVKDFGDFARKLGFRVAAIEACSGFTRWQHRLPNLLAQSVLYVLEPRSGSLAPPNPLGITPPSLPEFP